jgi:hypothetical protein
MASHEATAATIHSFFRAATPLEKRIKTGDWKAADRDERLGSSGKKRQIGLGGGAGGKGTHIQGTWLLEAIRGNGAGEFNTIRPDLI